MKLKEYNEYKFQKYLDKLNYFEKREILWNYYFHINFDKYKYYEEFGIMSIQSFNKELFFSSKDMKQATFKIIINKLSSNWKEMGYAREYHCDIPSYLQNEYFKFLKKLK